ncbi:MAG: tRNA (5-methylaminomethyl-2-thiouridine)(34)-methyltransferase MnmD [Planctomycetota bacterium]
MPARNRQLIETPDPDLVAVITDDLSRTLRCKKTGVTWHSESGALAESLLVFLRNSGIESSFSAGVSVRILETGFGTGLNFWLAASAAAHCKAQLDYHSIETELLDPQVVSVLEHGQLQPCQPAHAIFADRIFAGDMRPKFNSGDADSFGFEAGDIRLTILKPAMLRSAMIAPASIDAVFHDPFGPEDEPKLWRTEYLQQMHSLLKKDGALVTYCVKSEIQRRLKTAGFAITKTRGPVGGKREVLIARPA